MNLTGEMLIGTQTVRGTQATQNAFNPIRNEWIPEPAFGMGGIGEVRSAASKAAAAFDTYRHLPLEKRALFLETIAENLLALGEDLIQRAHQESGLPIARLQGERGRTVAQLRLFAQIVREGHFLGAIVDTAQPERTPLPRSDIRLGKMPLGPVAVFGASNFPLAFSVAGGDTASALAAGAPVIVKAHSAHLGTSEMAGRAIQQAAQSLKLPEGVFSLIFGAGNAIGEALVADPAIKAVGFTGSRQGGLALQRIANARPEPIPVYAEMSSINPVFLLPGALSDRAEAIGAAYVDSLTQGAGQFCTNPGVVIALASADLVRFKAAAKSALASRSEATMLTPAIHSAYELGVAKLEVIEGVETLARVVPSPNSDNAAAPIIFLTTARRLLEEEQLRAEIFGPAGLLVVASSFEEMIAVAEQLEGQLTASVHLNADDQPWAGRLMPVLERKAGRILANGFPTGVEVCRAMVHGGPFPATSNAAFTSVGATAIERFLRPVCYQDMPDALLPPALQEVNPLGLTRLVDGRRVIAG